MITCSGTIGKCLPYDGRDAYFQDSNIVWIDNPTLEVSNEFLLNILATVNWGRLNSTTITRIYGPDLRDLAIRYPRNPTEQQRISSCLSSLDHLITAHTQKLNALKTHKKGLMQQLFPREGETVPRLRFPEFRDTEGWKEETGNALFDQVNDRNPLPGLPILAITQEHGAIPRDQIDYHVFVTEKSVESYKVVHEGDFIISLRSFQGGIEYSKYHGICSPAYVILRRRSEGDNEYFKHYLRTERFIRILTRNLEGLRDGKMVSYSQFSELLIPVPKPDEQRRIASYLSSVDHLITAHTQKLNALKTHKKGLMQGLFPVVVETVA